VHVLLKTTYDESIKGLSPSSLLRQDAYRHVFEEGVFAASSSTAARWSGFVAEAADQFAALRGVLS
jgi:hypothetical protein